MRNIRNIKQENNIKDDDEEKIGINGVVPQKTGLCCCNANCCKCSCKNS